MNGNATAAPCPPADDYATMLRGLLDEERSSALEAHLDDCEACRSVLDGLAVDPRLRAALRAGPPPSTDPPPAADGDSLVARIQDMAHQVSRVSFDPGLSAAGLGEGGSLAAGPAPDRVGGYRVVRLLGAGGMGMVYLAEDEALCRDVAVKLLRPRLAVHPRAREGFLREARAMASLKHDNVVTVFQVGESPGPAGVAVPFLAMELLEGECLADWLRREGPLPPSWAIRLARQAAEGLAAAHARGVVHRDVKPGNLWLEAPPGWADLPEDRRPALPLVARLKVLDFGLAQPAGGDDGDAGTIRRHSGTPAYMAPEQAAGQAVDARADLFSLGVVLHELVAGRLPRPAPVGSVETPPRSAPTPPTPGLSPALAALSRRLMAVDPADRPASAAQVARELTELPEARGLPDFAPTRPRTKNGWAVPALATLAALFLLAVWFAQRASPPRTATVESERLDRPGPPDDAWRQAVAALPFYRQPGAVADKLRELNPGYDGTAFATHFDAQKVVKFEVSTNQIADVRPIRALVHLDHLALTGDNPGEGRLVDLSPLKGLDLVMLDIWNNPGLTDLSPLRGMQLRLIQAGDTGIVDLGPLEEMPLEVLAVNDCKVGDLTPIRKMDRLQHLRCDGCPLDSIGPLAGLALDRLRFGLVPARGDLDVIETMHGLRLVNELPLKEFRRVHSQAR